MTIVWLNGKTAQILPSVKAKAGEHNRIVKRQGDAEQVLDDLIAKLSGDGLPLSYRDSTQVTLEGYYTECKALLACDITLPGADAKGYKPGADSGASLGDGSSLVYAHGAPDALMVMAQGQPALQAALSSLQGDQVTWLPTQGDWTLPLALMGGAAAVIVFGRGDTTPPVMPSMPMALSDDVALITGSVADKGITNDARPTFSDRGAEVGATVTLREGSSVLGTALVGADGSWQITPAAPLAEGVHRVSYTLTDPAGNQSVASPTLEFTVDTVAPNGLGVALDPADDGNAGNGVDLRVTLAPDARAGDIVTTAVSRDGVLVQTIKTALGAADIGAGHLLAHVDAASVSVDWRYSATTQLLDAAGNQGQAVSKGGAFTVFTGLVHDDYLANSFVFVDSNLNNRWDAGEPTTRTDASGHFQFAFDPNGAPVLAMGGVDTASGAANSAVVYKAYTGAIDAAAAGMDIVLSPLSTLIAAVAAQSAAAGQAIGQAELRKAAATVKQVLGLSSSNPIGLLSFDPVGAAAASGASDSDVGLLSANRQLGLLFAAAGALIDGAATDTSAPAGAGAAVGIGAMAQLVLSRGEATASLSLSSTADVEAVVQASMTASNVTGVTQDLRVSSASDLTLLSGVIAGFNARLDATTQADSQSIDAIQCRHGRHHRSGGQRRQRAYSGPQLRG